MAKCELCSTKRSARFIVGVDLCNDCFSLLQNIRNHNDDAIEHILHIEEYYPNASKNAIALFNKPIEQYRSEQEKIEMAAEKQRLLVEMAALQQARDQELKKRNPIYEYATEFVYDSNNGSPSKVEITNLLNDYACRGWHLHSLVVNEIGRDTNSIHDDGNFSGNNATLCVNILVFERLISPAEEQNTLGQ